MKLRFLGGTGTVTGSKYLLTVGNKKILIDCGLFQGLKPLRLKNWEPLPVDPKTIDAVVLTHAHIDHSGYLPLLVKNGFSKRIYSTPGTLDLCKILLSDSGHLQEEEARYANKKGFSKHKPALPLYSQKEAEHCLSFFHPVDFEEEFSVGNGIAFRFLPAGHILGSAMVLVSAEGKTILFTGDLGRPNDLIMNPPAKIQRTDYLVVESTYGNRRHDPRDPKEDLAGIINRTARRKGVLVVPAFAVGRAQALLYYIHLLKSADAIPDIPVFLNSP
ncbi:MBL fold metallo-hydrolase, partial [bacterium]